MPLAAHATWVSGQDRMLDIAAAWGEPDASAGQTVQPPLVRARLTAVVTDHQQAAQLGTEVAALLMAGGARSLARTP